MEVDELKGSINNLNNTINNLRDSINLKDDQIKIIKDSMNLKDNQIKTLESSLKFKEEKIETLEKTIKLKEEQIRSTAIKVNADLLEEKNKEIEDLQKEIEILNGELTKADEDLERLELENEKLKKKTDNSSDSKIIDFSSLVISKSEIIEKMREILQNALHSVTIAVPNINELQELYLYELRSSVNLKISCEINPGNEEDAELLEEYESLDNISIRNFKGSDRYVLVRDGEELLFAAIGNNESNHLAFHTKDPAHIRIFNSLVMETWLRSRPI